MTVGVEATVPLSLAGLSCWRRGLKSTVTLGIVSARGIPYPIKMPVKS